MSVSIFSFMPTVVKLLAPLPRNEMRATSTLDDLPFRCRVCLSLRVAITKMNFGYHAMARDIHLFKPGGCRGFKVHEAEKVL